MATVNQTEQPRGTGTSTYSETPEQQRGWEKLADWIEEQVAQGLLLEGDTFLAQGYVHKMELDAGGKFFSKKIKDRQTQAEKVTTYTETTAVITDPRFTEPGVPLPLPRKQLGTSFFDGRMRDGTRGIARGAMYHLHLAVTFSEPPPELVNNKGSWDTDSYTGREHPVMLVITFAGWEPEGSQYFNSRCGAKVFLDKFERDMEARKAQAARAKSTPVANLGGGEFDDDPDPTPAAPAGSARGRGARAKATPTASGRGAATTQDEPPFEPGTMRIVDTPVDMAAPTRGRRAGAASAGAAAAPAAASTATASASDPASAKATERQIKFIFAIAREAALDDQELQDWSQELYEQPVEELNRRDASALIEALQRRRNEVA